jgi:hypothetical protein
MSVPSNAALSLKPAELEAVIARLCTCGMRRVKSNRPQRVAGPCAERSRAEWCRLGARVTPGTRYVDTRFG